MRKLYYDNEFPERGRRGEFLFLLNIVKIRAII